MEVVAEIRANEYVSPAPSSLPPSSAAYGGGAVRRRVNASIFHARDVKATFAGHTQRPMEDLRRAARSVNSPDADARRLQCSPLAVPRLEF